MRVALLYFAVARERAGTTQETIEVPDGLDVAALRALLSERHPALAAVLPRCRIAIGEEFAGEAEPIPPGARVAVIPPVAGGAGPIVRIAADLPPVEELIASVKGPDAGGVVLFLGSVRGQSHGREVVRLDYEAFGPMAERKLREIAAECQERFGARVSIAHRTGSLSVGDPVVIIAAAAAHRAEAFEACSHAISRLKEDVPIWKKEHFSDGSEWVGFGP